MNFLPTINLPLTNPVVIFAIFLFIILLSPIVLKKFKIPGIVGLILSGMMVGPHGFNLLAMDSSVILFGTIGLLYIMFLAGVELDLNEFRKSKFQSLLFGLLIFSISSSLGFMLGFYILHYSLLTSILIGAMCSTFTLVSYPIVSRLGLVSHKTMVLAVGGVVVTDLLALIVLVMTKSIALNSGNSFILLKIILSFLVFILIVLLFFPKIAKWYFKNIEEVGTWQFIFVLALLFSGAFMAQLAGFEPIIGAFATGLALNPLIPKNSSLMDKISFFGNSIFIPFFLIQVGMLINIGVIFKSWEIFGLALLLLSISFSSKLISSLIIQKSYNFSSTERNFLFGISISQAAALIAIVLVGFQIGILNENIFNSSVLIVLISCLISSFFTEYYGRKLALEQDSSELNNRNISSNQRIMVSVSKPETVSRLIEFGIMIKEYHNTSPILALMVIEDESQIVQKFSACQKIITNTAKEISPRIESQITMTSKIDINISGGISKAILENLVTDVIIGLNEKNFGKNKVFGNVMQNLLEDTNQTVFAIKNQFPLNTVDKLLILLPENAEFELGFSKTINTLIILAKNIGAKVDFFGFQKSIIIVQKILQSERKSVQFGLNVIDEINEYEKVQEKIESDDMIICLLSRPKSISHNIQYESLIEKLVESAINNNLSLIYPEQNPAIIAEDISHFDILDTSPIQENIARIEKFKNYLKKVLKK